MKLQLQNIVKKQILLVFYNKFTKVKLIISKKSSVTKQINFLLLGNKSDIQLEDTAVNVDLVKPTQRLSTLRGV